MIRWRWGIILALGGLLLFGGGPGSARAGETPSRSGMDARLFAGELQSRGAFQFAEDTEDRIRSGQFELAFARYLFLRSQIRGSSLYMALNAMVDQRLHFLKNQMGLREIPRYAAPYKKLKTRVRKEPPVTPTAAEPKDGKAGAKPVIIPAATEAVEKPEESVTPPTPAEPPEEEAPEEKVEEKKPAPPPSTWERVKRRLKFW